MLATVVNDTAVNLAPHGVRSFVGTPLGTTMGTKLKAIKRAGAMQLPRTQ
jgi:hypothetical protein